MWNTWMEKAKTAAAAIDQQLNESVGAEHAIAKKEALSPSSGADGEGSSVWNDDDFKFDDDDEETTTPPAPSAAAVPAAPDAAENTSIAAVPPAASPEVATATTTEKENDGEANNNNDVATTADETTTVASKAASSKVESSVAPSEDPSSQQPQPPPPAENATNQQPTSPTSAASSGGFGLGGFGSLVGGGGGGEANKAPAAAGKGEINFMSPFSTILSSLSNDQDHFDMQEEERQLQQQAEDEMQNNNSAATTPAPSPKVAKQPPEPVAAESKKDEKVNSQQLFPAEGQDPSEGAWKEDDIDLGDDDDDDEVIFAAATKDSESTKPTSPVKEEKKSEETVPKETSSSAQAPQPVQETAEAPAVSKAPSAAETAESSNAAAAGPVVPAAEMEALNKQLAQFKEELAQREMQLAAKSDQLFQLQQMYEKDKADLVKKVTDTKDEAKKRIAKARERCEAAEAKLQASKSALSEDAAKQSEIIDSLREEGQKLAHKQAEMERMVRTARGEARTLKEELVDQTSAKETALAKIEKLQADLKSTQEQLTSARKGETQAGKLETELQRAKEEIANKANAIMALEQNVKELISGNKELAKEAEESRQGLAMDNQKAVSEMRKEHNDALSDLETKLQTTEREAAVREDALRHEVEELRKRWQDAVRRADASSMDVQSSTAPLLRQLESMERQQRARATAAAELETKLRAELEESVIQYEKLSKEHTELKTKYNRLERQSKEQQNDLEERQRTIDELQTKIASLEGALQSLRVEFEKRREEYERVERLANEGVTKVRSEMSQAVMDSEDRYRSQLDTITEELRIEKEKLRIETDKRGQLEQQVDQLLENAAMIVPNPANRDSKPVKLRESEGQAEILQGALMGLGGESGDDTDDNLSDDEGDVAAKPELHHQTSTGSSYAALEQLTQNLKSTKKELTTLRKRLEESEKTRESLLEDLSECRGAKEKIPLFEAKVKELMADNKEKELEIRGLRDDIVEVKEMYRSQLNMLLEEQAAIKSAEAAKKAEMNGGSKSPEKVEEPVPELVEDALGGIANFD